MGTVLDEPSSYGAEVAKGARAVPMPLAASGKMVLSWYGKPTPLSTA
jgi:hypothetical protein